MTESNVTRETLAYFKWAEIRRTSNGHMCLLVFEKAGTCYQGWAGLQAPHLVVVQPF